MEIPPQARTDDPPIEQLCSQRKLRRVLKFTSNEDDCLKRGVDRHGFGQWTAILRDPDFKFQEGRTADSLKKRAGLKPFSGNAPKLNTFLNAEMRLFCISATVEPRFNLG